MQQNNKKTAIVTGGLGFIGSHLCDLLYKSNYNVVVFDKNTYATEYTDPNMTKNTKKYHIDVSNYNGLLEGITTIKNIDVIFHLAAESHVDNSISSPRQFIQTNIIGTYNILELCRKNKIPLVYVSTDEVYGSWDKNSKTNSSWTESCPLEPTSPYATSKACGDLLAMSYHQTYGMDIKLTRACNNFGCGQHLEKLIPKSITTALTDQKIYLYGDGSNIRQWIHVSDHCEGILLVHTNGVAGEIYNIGSTDISSNYCIAELIKQALNQQSIEICYIKDRINHDWMYHINYDKILKLGFNPKQSIKNKEVWDEMVEYYKKYQKT